ncbi:MAG TPA: outer membrane beta-barrel protein [Flavitalea sp.]|nr:outer membrane beta-barrel protein [Flavitalea sp.]
MRSFILLFILTTLFNAVSAQKNGAVRGSVFDSISSQFVGGATVTLLKKKDSSLVSFTMTDNKGQFEITSLADGDYRLLLTHINYHNSSTHFSITAQKKQADLGAIQMKDLAQILSEVTVTAEAPPVTLVGDTIQYNAGSFKTPPNANVEQLLKNMPGMKVDKDGTITAQGQKVSRVLVDGKEFFGSDPKIATRNLPADAVDKVQAYDRLSDAAQLTGIDDGNSEKTINLKLKKEKKKGMFGKVNAGAGTADRYEGRFNLNSFKGARQLSAIGMANNTNAEGFSIMDMLNFSGELNRMKQGGNGGGMMINLSDNQNGPMSGMNGSSGTGINSIAAGGINYNNLIGNGTDFTSNLFYNKYSPLRETSLERTYLLPDSSYLYNQQSVTHNTTESYRLNLGADIRIDSFHSIKISPSLGFQQTDNSSISNYKTMSNAGQVSNDGDNNNRSFSEGFNFRNEILFRKKFRQKGRTFSLNLMTTLNQSEGDGSMISNNNFFSKTGSAVRNDSINQINTNEADLWSYNLRGVYTEPIFKNTLLELTLGKSNSVSNAAKVTYDYNAGSGKYDKLNPYLTNDFSNTYGYTNGGIKLRAVRNKFNIAAGISAQQADLEGKVILGTKDSVIQQRFQNLLPNARLQYNFTRYKNLSLNYSTNTTQPTMAQLQPVPDISDPLNIRAGNPGLKQEYTHALQLNLTSVNPFKNKNLFVFLTMNQTTNKIVNNDVIDQFGVKTTIPVNIDGVTAVSGRASWGIPLQMIKANLNISSDITYNKGKQFINNVANEIKNVNLGPQVRLDLNFSTKFYMTAGAELRYSSTSYSLPSAKDAIFLVQEYNTDINWEMPANFFFNTNYTYTINTQQADGFNTRFPLWNASLSKQFLKYNRGELKITAFDIMNKNVGISRNANQNFIEDKRVNNLQRYFLLSFTYSLSKNAATAKQPGMIKMIR